MTFPFPQAGGGRGGTQISWALDETVGPQRDKPPYKNESTPPEPAPAPAPLGGARLRLDEVVGPQRDKSRLSAGPALPSVAPPAKKKSVGGEEAGPNGKKKPGGQNGGNRKPASEGGEKRMMGGWSSAEELASSEGVGLAEGVPQSRMRRAYARIASPTTRYRLLRSGMTDARYHSLRSGMTADTWLPAFVCRHILATF